MLNNSKIMAFNCFEIVFYVIQRLAYSKSDSDIIAKMKGTFSERTKEKKKKKKEPKKVCFILFQTSI